MGIEKKYYSIGEVADLFEVNTSLIRFWEGHFVELKPQKKKGGVRKYTKEDIDTFKQIFNLVKVKGYTIKGAQHILQENKKMINEEKQKEKLLNELLQVKEFLGEIKTSIVESK